MFRQTISEGTKTYRHIFICDQAVSYGMTSENGTKDITFNQSLVSNVGCNDIISH